MTTLLKPKEITVTGLDGEQKAFVLHRLPAVQGREIVAKYPMSALPKIGDYATNEETMLKLMQFVAAKSTDGHLTPLSTRALVDSHVTDWEMLFQIEKGMLAYNTSFFTNEKTFDFFDTLKATSKAWLISMLTDLSAASSKPKGPRSKS